MHFEPIRWMALSLSIPPYVSPALFCFCLLKPPLLPPPFLHLLVAFHCIVHLLNDFPSSSASRRQSLCNIHHQLDGFMRLIVFTFASNSYATVPTCDNSICFCLPITEYPTKKATTTTESSSIVDYEGTECFGTWRSANQ